MAQIEYRSIPNVSKPVSRIFFGTASQPFMSGGDGSRELDAMFALGINAFDTARRYDMAEKSLGDWIARRGIRDQVVILSKCAHPTVLGRRRVNEKEIRRDFAESARLLQTDYIDIYLLHRDDPRVEARAIVEIFNAMHAEGKIGAFGGSNWTHQRIQEANEYAEKHNLIPFTVSSPNFGLADQVRDPWGGGCVSISGPANEAAREWYAQQQMPVIAYSSLGRGLFSGRVRSDDPKSSKTMDANARKGYISPENLERLRRCEALAAAKGCTVAQIAMAWIYCQNVNTFAIVNTSSPQRMQQNIDAVSLELTQEEAAYLDLRG